MIFVSVCFFHQSFYFNVGVETEIKERYGTEFTTVQRAEGLQRKEEDKSVRTIRSCFIFLNDSQVIDILRILFNTLILLYFFRLENGYQSLSRVSY